MRQILDLEIKELEEVLIEWRERSFHSRQIFCWIYQKGITEFSAMSNLSLELREKLEDNFYITKLRLVKGESSLDGTEKLLFALKDKNLIEAVSIPTEKRVTGCISTQVGCKFNCLFCASARRGFKRNLTSGEMIEEVLYLKNKSRRQMLTHIVFMGIGEPLDNYSNLLKSIRIINSPEGLHLGSRRITISTCGLIPAIKRLSTEGLQIELSISLHAADDKVRDKIMPINKKYPLEKLIRAAKEYIQKTNRQITFEYVLIQGLNSDLESAANLGRMLEGLNCKINLIPANPIRGLKISAPNKLETLLFRDSLLKKGLKVTLRRARGEDIEAACGQLRLRYEDK